MTIDERIVSLGFNNQNFEKHAQQSLSTLDKLDHTLDALGGSNGISQMASALEAVANKFSVLGTIGDQVLRRIADSVMDVVGKIGQLGKSLSVDQITAGWNKYADKTSAVQTIMAATAKDWDDTGKQMEYVNGQLEKLNWFTDETSYSFLDMVNNIGKFTSNGIGLEESVTSMQGISTWAAISGANVGEASRAMYNLSQALAVGSVKLMDWKSIENANMATREFKETAIQTAVELGTLKDNADGTFSTLEGHAFTIEQFNTQLSDGWFSKDVLQATLKQYGDFTNVLYEVSDATGETASTILSAIETYENSGNKITKDIEWISPYIQKLTSDEYELGRKAFKAAQEAKTFAEAIDATKDAVSTGWMNTFEKIFGNYQEAKTLWTGLANGLWEIFAGGGETRNAALDMWTQLGDRAKLFIHTKDELGAIYRLGNSFLGLFDELRGGLLTIFGPKILDTKGMEYEVAQLYLIFHKLTDQIVSVADAAEYFVQKLQESEAIGKIFEGLHNIWVGLKMPITALGRALKETLTPILEFPTEHPWIDVIVNGLSKIADWLLKVSESFKTFMQSSEGFSKLMRIAQGFASIVDIAVTAVKELYHQLFDNFEPAVQRFRLDNIIEVFAKIGDVVTNLVTKLKESGTITKAVTLLAEAFRLLGDIVDVVFLAFNSLFTSFTSHAGTITSIANRILDVAINFVTMLRSTINQWIEGGTIEGAFSSIGSAVESLFTIFSKVVDFFVNNSPFEAISNVIGRVAEKISNAFNAIATAYDKAFNTENRVGPGIGGITAALGGLYVIIKKLVTGVKVSKIVDNLKKITDLKGLFEGFKKSIASVFVSIKDAINSFAMGTKAKALKDVAIAIGILAAALVALSLIDSTKLAVSLGVVTAGLGELIGALAIVQNIPMKNKGFTTEMIKMAGAVLMFSMAIVNVSIALLIVAAAIRVIANLEPQKILVSVVALIAMLAAMAGILGVLADKVKPGRLLAAGAALLMLAAAIAILAVSLLVLSLVKPEKLATAILGLAATLVVMAVVLGLLGKLVDPGRLLAAGAAMLMLSAAILALTAALVILALIPGDALGKSLIFLAGGIIVMAAALAFLSLAGPMTLAAGGAMLLLGIAMIAMSAAMVILAAALRLMQPVKNDIKKIAGGLALLGLAMIPLGIGGIAMALGLLGFAALLPLALALRIIGPYAKNIPKIAGGLALLAPVLVLLGVAGLALLVGAPGLLLGGIAFVIFGAGLRSLAEGMKAMQGVSLKTMAAVAAGVALIGLAGIPLLVGALGLAVGVPALVSLAEALPKIAAGFMAFGEVKWGEIGKGAVALAAAVTALFLLEFATIIDGTPVLVNLANALPGIAQGFMAFEGVNWGDIGKGAAALATAITSLFLLQFATIRDGTPTLVNLANAIPGIAQGFSSFETINADMILKGAGALATAITSLFTLQFATIRDGTPALVNLSLALPGVASGFKSFEDLNPETIILVSNAMKTCINSLFTAGLASIIDGTPALVSLGQALPILAAGFHAFDGMDPEWVAALGQGLANGIKALMGDFFSNLFKGNVDFITLANGIYALAIAVSMVPVDSEARLTGIANGILAMSSIVVESLSLISTGLQQILMEIELTMQTILMTMTMSFTQLTMQITMFSTTTTMRVRMLITTTTMIVRQGIMQLTMLVRQAIMSISMSIQAGLAQMNAAIQMGVSYMMMTLQYAASQAYYNGMMIGQGLANGLWSQVGNVRAAANALAAAANTGVAGPMEVASPSRVMIRMGEYIGEGLGIGIQNESDVVEKATTDVITPLLLTLQELMDGDFDMSPEITPVVDISDARDAAGKLSSMFGGGRSYAISAAGRISANETSQGRFGNYSSVGDTSNVINVYAQPGQDVNELATIIERRLVRLNKQQRLGALK